MTIEGDTLNMIGWFYISLITALNHFLTAKITKFKTWPDIFKADDMSALLAFMYWTFAINKKFK